MGSNVLFPWNEVTLYLHKLPALWAEVVSRTLTRQHAFILLDRKIALNQTIFSQDHP